MSTDQMGPDALAAVQITHGNPTAEEIAALTAIISAMDSTDHGATAPSGTELRRGRIRRRRALNAAPLPWKVGRQ
ncbi:acyl-CoA carboxylase subunit epsilon [Paeniglutamicibacter gangotriensis]|uniref:Acyl-CoA carboxylase subunit epsilon n=1 Tax=Paeniglutamicibacter gangotriensis TaxID=254787 RepID=A0A5B0EFZ0_9MICC|nr:acyl-CoA carboxylase subunit epsilon [Paeniglutamicibacter gangotriensis]KAA0977578.1 acyl-CoA carboxylase subunit epsilon [Paeniglutamicibacter gangotriensis]